jgi:hypothetical protein
LRARFDTLAAEGFALRAAIGTSGVEVRALQSGSAMCGDRVFRIDRAAVRDGRRQQSRCRKTPPG